MEDIHGPKDLQEWTKQRDGLFINLLQPRLIHTYCLIFQVSLVLFQV